MLEYTKFHIDRQVIKGNLVSHVELLNVRTLDKQPEVVESDLPGGYSGSFRKTRNMLKTYEEHSIFRKNRSAVQQYVVFFSLFPQYPLQRKLQRIKNIYLISLHIRSMWETICDAWACWSGWNFGPNSTEYPYSEIQFQNTPPPPKIEI